MSITDELRKFANDRIFFGNGYAELNVIADRIDAEHERVRAESIIDMTDESMAEHGWVRLPKDADGEYIHIGNELDVGFVARIVITDDEWPPYLYAYKETPHILTQHFCNEVSHYHAPTVEDVLTEFAAKLIERGELTNGGAQTIAEYAAKLQLREDA